jgi:YidC/Oxa1 family membrane protein insertase
MTLRHNTAVRSLPHGIWDVFLPLHQAWWTALGLPMLALLHWMTGFLAAYPLTLAIGPFGLSVIVMTVLIRLVLLPLAAYQARVSARHARALAELQPEVERLRRRHRGSPERLAAELADLYRSRGVNPLGPLWALVPGLLQAPVLLAFYWVILALAQSGGTDLHFLWIANLAVPDPVLLPLMAAAVTYLGARLAQRDQRADAGQTSLNWLAYMTPVVVLISFHLAPAALALYWFVQCLLVVVQQRFLNRGLGLSRAS